MQIPAQKIITKDNVSIDIAAVAYYHISDPEKAVIAIENVYDAINQTTYRDDGRCAAFVATRRNCESGYLTENIHSPAPQYRRYRFMRRG